MKKVLIIDDEIDILEVLEILLESEFPFELILKDKSQEAFNLLESGEHFDLIICDMNMPKVSGPDIYRYNLTHAKIPFILLTADAEDGRKALEQIQLEEKIQLDFLTVNKPWAEEDLFNAVRSSSDYQEAS